MYPFNLEQHRHYHLVAAAITYIRQNAIAQPSLKDIAAAVCASEHHLQRTFSHWAGISPKRFLQYLTKETAKQQLQQSHDVLTVTMQSGLSSLGRLHDLMVTCEAMSPGEIKSGGAGLNIDYGVSPTPFGDALIGWTSRGVCYLHFLLEHEAINTVTGTTTGTIIPLLKAQWPEAHFHQNQQGALQLGEKIFCSQNTSSPLHLLLKGSNFQVKVWEALLRLPPGHTISYSHLAKAIEQPKASRAIGNALAANHIGFLIPCHRVIRSTGDIGQYRWGEVRKSAMLAREYAIHSEF